jgi:cytochrome c oxidase subunit 2
MNRRVIAIRGFCWTVALLGLTVGARAQDAGPTPAGEPNIPEYTYGRWLPPAASEHAGEVDGLIDIMHWFMAVIFVGWAIFFVWCLFKFHHKRCRRANPMPIKAKPSKWAEVVVAAFEAVLLIGFSIPIWAAAKTTIPTESEDTFHVRVVAQQFAWNVHYPGPDGKFGKTDASLINPAANPIGLDYGDPATADDFVKVNDLHVPVGKLVRIDLSSMDVIHSLFLPVMRVKQDAIPGMTIPVWFKPTEIGRSEIQCAQLCGNNHSIMRGYLTVHPTDPSHAARTFDKWAEEEGPAEEFEDF